MNFSTVNSERLMEARRVVLKIGSALFVDQELGVLRHQWLESLCADIVDMREAGKEIPRAKLRGDLDDVKNWENIVRSGSKELLRRWRDGE